MRKKDSDIPWRGRPALTQGRSPERFIFLVRPLPPSSGSAAAGGPWANRDYERQAFWSPNSGGYPAVGIGLMDRTPAAIRGNSS
jgi:hypothetical protein